MDTREFAFRLCCLGFNMLLLFTSVTPQSSDGRNCGPLAISKDESDSNASCESEETKTPAEIERTDSKLVRKKSSFRKSENKQISDLRPPAKHPLASDREKSLHPNRDRGSASYSGRRAPGPDHGPDPHGPDPHDENQLYGQPGYPSDDPYGGSVPNGQKPY